MIGHFGNSGAHGGYSHGSITNIGTAYSSEYPARVRESGVPLSEAGATTIYFERGKRLVPPRIVRIERQGK